MSPIYDFRGMSEFELSAAVKSGRATNLATHPHSKSNPCKHYIRQLYI
jgi:hypothetical protein